MNALFLLCINAYAYILIFKTLNACMNDLLLLYNCNCCATMYVFNPMHFYVYVNGARSPIGQQQQPSHILFIVSMRGGDVTLWPRFTQNFNKMISGTPCVVYDDDFFMEAYIFYCLICRYIKCDLTIL